jgi:ribose-phosphate pyrophosphokinase
MWVTDTLEINQPQAREARVEVLTVAPLLAQAIQRIHKDLSVSSLFS